MDNLNFKKWFFEGLWMNDKNAPQRKKTAAEERGNKTQPPPRDPYNSTFTGASAQTPK